jgi:hypothetical protein
MICVSVHLHKGDNEVEMEFSRWDDTSHGARPLAIAITELSFLPDVAFQPDPTARPA